MLKRNEPNKYIFEFLIITRLYILKCKRIKEKDHNIYNKIRRRLKISPHNIFAMSTSGVRMTI